jgi:hypothetical protein
MGQAGEPEARWPEDDRATDQCGLGRGAGAAGALEGGHLLHLRASSTSHSASAGGGVLALGFGDVGPVVLSLPALHDVRCITHHEGHRRAIAGLASDDVEPRFLLGLVPPPLLRRGKSPATERVSIARTRQLLRSPERRPCWMLKDSPELPHHRDSQAGQVPLIRARARERAQTAPSAARRMCDNRMRAIVGARIPLDVVRIHAGHALVNAVRADEQCSDRGHNSPPSDSHSLAAWCMAVGSPSHPSSGTRQADDGGRPREAHTSARMRAASATIARVPARWMRCSWSAGVMMRTGLLSSPAPRQGSRQPA